MSILARPGFLLAAAILPFSLPEVATRTSGCTPDRLGARAGVVKLSAHESDLGELLYGADPADLEVVTNDAVCNKLRREIADTFDVAGPESRFIATYYEVKVAGIPGSAAEGAPPPVALPTETVFIVHINTRAAVYPPPAPPGQVVLTEGFTQVLVFDERYNKLGSFLV